jgi:hypothetical protein
VNIHINKYQLSGQLLAQYRKARHERKMKKGLYQTKTENGNSFLVRTARFLSNRAKHRTGAKTRK